MDIGDRMALIQPNRLFIFMIEWMWIILRVVGGMIYIDIRNERKLD